MKKLLLTLSGCLLLSSPANAAYADLGIKSKIIGYKDARAICMVLQPSWCPQHLLPTEPLEVEEVQYWLNQISPALSLSIEDVFIDIYDIAPDDYSTILSDGTVNHE